MIPLQTHWPNFFRNSNKRSFIELLVKLIRRLGSVCCTRWPPELKIENTLNYMFFLTTDPFLNHCSCSVQVCLNSFALLHKMAANAKNRKILNSYLLLYHLPIFKSIHTNVPLMTVYQMCSISPSLGQGTFSSLVLVCLPRDHEY